MARKKRKKNPLMKGIRLAKKIARKHPTWSWNRCVKEAWKEINKKKR